MDDQKRLVRRMVAGCAVTSFAITLVFADFSTIRWLSLLTVVLVGVWAFAARYAGRHSHAAEQRMEAEAPPVAG